MIWLHPFASLESFSNPQQIIKGPKGEEMPYGLARYNQLVNQCYIISKKINTSYTDLMNVTPKELDTMLELIEEETKQQNEQYEKMKKKLKK